MVTDVEMQDDQAEKNCGPILDTITETLLKHYRERKNTFLLQPKNKTLSVLTSKVTFSAPTGAPNHVLHFSAQDDKGLLVTDSSSTQLMHPHNSFNSEIFEWADFA